MPAILDLPEVRARVQRWTVDHYARLVSLGEVSEHAELIRGVIVEKMSKSPLHEFLTDGINEYLRDRVQAGFCVRQESSLRLADSVPEPDAAVVRGSREDFRSRQPATAELVVEVAVSSAALDRENASLYAEAGVVEYWIVLGPEERVEVHRQPVNGVYQSRRVYGLGETIEDAAGLTVPVPVAELFV